MAVETPTKPQSNLAGKAWDRFVRNQIAYHPNVKTLEHLAISNPEAFTQEILKLDAAAKPEELIKDIKDSHHTAHADHPKEEKHESAHQEKSHNTHHDSFAKRLMEGAVPGIMTAVRKPQFMEEDPALWKIIGKMDKEWDENNKKPGWRASKEEKLGYEEAWVNHKYGDLDNPESKSVEEKAKEALKKQYESEYHLDEKGEFKRDKSGNPIKKSDKQIKKDQEKLAHYETNENKTTQSSGMIFRRRQVPITFDKDTGINRMKYNINQEGYDRYNLLRKKGLKGKELDQSYKAIMERIKEKHMRAYVEAHPEKAEHFFKEDYKNKNEHAKADFELFKKTHEKVKAEIEEKKAVAEAVSITTTPIPKGIENDFKDSDEHSLDPTKKPDPVSHPVPPTTPNPPATTTVPAAFQDAFRAESDTHLDPAHVANETKPINTMPTSSMQAPQLPISAPKSTAQTDTKAPAIPKPSGKLDKAATVVTIVSDPKAAAISAGSGFVRRRFISTTTGLGNRLLGEKRTAQLGGAFGKANKALQLVSDPKAAIQNMITDKITNLATNYVKNLALNAAKQIGTRIAQFLLTNPYFWAAVGIIVLIILLICIIVTILKGGNITNPEQSNTIIGLTLRLEGPDAVPNSTNISYRIIATYTGNGDITISDPLPGDTTFVSATGNYQISFGAGNTNTVSWKLKDNQSSPDAGGSTAKNYTFTLVLHPDKMDTLVRNKVYASMVGGGSGGTIPSNPNATDFETLMRGQGRNTGVLGDENSFVQKILSAGESRLSGKEQLLRQLYQAALARTINPLVLVSDWGLESGYDATGRFYALGCDPYGYFGTGKDFQSQLACSTATWDNLMKEYDKKALNGIPVHLPSEIGKNCDYDDAFLYAAERYGPVCVKNDGNDYFHSNFYKNYKMFLGQ